THSLSYTYLCEQVLQKLLLPGSEKHLGKAQLEVLSV
ncbi:unnamed protein product, partial [marine sediment metagenome]